MVLTLVWFPSFSFLSIFFSKDSNTHLNYAVVSLKPNTDANKVAKKRGRPSTKVSSPTKKAAAAVDSSDDHQASNDVKSEVSDDTD
jgi:hypothetical protein